MEKHVNSEELVKLQIKFGGQTIPLSMNLNSTIADLKLLLKSSTNVLPRGQKLIHKGNVLEDSKTLKASNITNGSKIMLMASQGLHQGEGPKIKNAPVVSNYQKIVEKINKDKVKFGAPVAVNKTRIERWKIIGVIGLSESQLKAIPDEVWDCGSSARVLDLSKNSISEISVKISCMKNLQKLILNANDISDDSISWQGLNELKGLTYLCLSQNCLTNLPAALGALTSLEQLLVAGNKLESLPIEFGQLTKLQILKVNNNRISTLPSCIGDCSALIEVDISSNLLVELPETFGNLQNLKALHLSNNGLKSLPSTLFKKCVKLSTLDLHETEITMDMLREVEGWEEFDERRRLKYQKQLDFRAGGSAAFDEGADKN
ncbi:plant intracellular Ras-group-related LRR protein 8 isoform X1 [Amaranthus tricolor]|uniref:plant intracellular Ras-group-related LRR protein 8 isoform X1 n=1 Tax=Amaranthus tricolor TaxID=29722 RepID=UPI00258E283B|nr:plant intracellular Ras-group-related LRR protein 8 isoform X1 [Amaranthus tricolor]